MNDITIKIGDRTLTIGGIRDPEAARRQIAQMAATIAAGIEADTHNDDNWMIEDTVCRSLAIATEIFLATTTK
jgi:hypothetical protein